jgi:hypothetical protein
MSTEKFDYQNHPGEYIMSKVTMVYLGKEMRRMGIPIWIVM